MAAGGKNGDDKPVGELFARLVDDGRSYAKAEFSLVRANVEAKAQAAKKPALFGAAAFLFLQAGVVVLAMTLALSLATMVGPLAGGLIAAAVTFALAGLLGYLAKRELDGGK